MASKREYRRKGPRERESSKDRFRPATPTFRQWSCVELTFASAAAIVLVTIVWGEPRPVGDYYIGLAAGRDMISSRFACLTQPDTWSFMTPGRVWLNQNWGTHLIYYLVYELGGELGSLALKCLLLTAMAVFVAMVCRQRGVNWPMAILAGSGAVAAGRSFIDLRPNLMTFMIIPLVVWLLYRARDNSHRAWAVVPAVALWANVHGGFIFGLGMTGLWALCMLVTLSFSKGLKVAFRRYWPVLATAAAAVVVSGTLSPFGFANLTHPLVVGRSPRWRTISEWRPVYELSWFGSTWEFYLVVGLLTALPVLCGLVFLTGRDRGRQQLTMGLVGPLVFSAVLCITLFVLAADWQVKPGAIYESLRQDRRMILLVTAVLGILSSTVVGVLLSGQTRGRYAVVRPEAHELATLIFELCLAGIVIAMAIKARRFIPLAVILVIPMAARQAQSLLRAYGKGWPMIPAAVALLVPALLTSQELFKYYHPDNPMLPAHTTFQRMMAYDSYPLGAGAFINANGLSGRVYNKWEWEGFLHWKCPQVKLFMGGRAQQIYSLETHELRYRIGSNASRFSDELRNLSVHLAVVPASFGYRQLIGGLVDKPGSRWAHVYFDGKNAVLADGDWPETRALIDRVVEGDVRFLHGSIAALSRARCLSSKVVGADEGSVTMALMEANALKPTPRGYKILKTMAEQGRLRPEALIPYLEKQRVRLWEMPVDSAGGSDTLACRLCVAEMLSGFYGRAGDRLAATRWAQRAAGIRQDMATMKNRWEGTFSLQYYPPVSLSKKGLPHPMGL